jgi:hypothetical protein
MLVVADKEECVSNIVPSVVRLKLDFWQHEGIILHSRDIRKAYADFAILKDANIKSRFMAGISNVMTASKYDLIAVSINKEKLNQNHGYPTNPYSLSLAFALESLVLYLEGKKLERETYIIAEARGGKEDQKLFATFNQILSNGTTYCSAERFKRHKLQVLFRTKANNIIGHQIADLAAYPTARFVIDRSKKNPAYDVIASKFCRVGERVYGFMFSLKNKKPRL